MIKNKKPTKKAKKVDLKLKEVKSYISAYRCPTCGIEFMGCGIKKNVLRFVCDCGQELKVNFILKESI